jgi:hypothetical protein
LGRAGFQRWCLFPDFSQVRTLSNFTALAAVGLAKAKGFAAICPEGSAIVLPAGCIMISFPLDPKKDTSILRWSFIASNAATTSCWKLLVKLFEDMPPLSATLHFKLLKDRLQSIHST